MTPFIGIAGFIGNHDPRRGSGQQCIDTFQVTILSRREVRPGGIVQGIDGGMDNLLIQLATAASDGLILFLASALC